MDKTNVILKVITHNMLVKLSRYGAEGGVCNFVADDGIQNYVMPYLEKAIFDVAT